MAIMSVSQRKFWRQPRAPVRAPRDNGSGRASANIGNGRHGNMARIIDRKGYVRK